MWEALANILVCELSVSCTLDEEESEEERQRDCGTETRERNKGGKTDCVFKCIASSEATVTTRESISSAAALQPLLHSIISISLCFGQLGAEKQPQRSQGKLSD